MAGNADLKSLLAEMPETPEEIAASLREFTASARALSGQHRRPIDKYPDKWVAVSDGTVRADADSLDELLVKIDAAGIPRAEVIIRLIERTPRTLIL